MPNTKINPNATHVSALVAFAPNGGKLSEAFEWLLVESEANVADIFAAARRKARAFLPATIAENATCFVVEVNQQWGADGIAL